MPWWGWLIIGIAVVVIVPIKIKIMKKLISKKKEDNEENIKDF
ncbi:hypothetical protein [Abyssisolibacter fermentans]|nr:hypothetical protein [Abyssisolibacter fermentans]